MKKNLKFLDLMARLDATELLRFEKYLLWEYPKEGNALKVFRYYKRFFPKKEDSDKMALPYAFRKIYGVEMGPRMSEPKKLWNAFSKLYGWLKDFLILEKLKADPYTRDVLWLEILQKKELNAEHAKQAIAAYQTDYNKSQDIKASLQQIELSTHYRLQLIQGRPVPDYEAIQPCVKKIQEHADLISLQMQCELSTIKDVRPSKLPTQAAAENQAPLNLIYAKILQMLQIKETEHYDEVDALLQFYGKQIPRDHTNTILRYLQNHAAKMFREEDERFWGNKIHRLNKVTLEKESYTPQKEMPATHFQNIVSFACTAIDLDWGSKFIEEYAQYLPEKTREENIYVAQISIAFARKDFQTVLELCEKPVFKDEIQILRIKVFQLRSMYELGMDMDISDTLNAYTKHLRRQKKPIAVYKPSAIAFMYMLNLLSQKKVSKKALIKALEERPQIFARAWLNEKIETYQSVIYGNKE